MSRRPLRAFDAVALYGAMDEQRRTRELSWAGVAREIWALSADLNARRDDHPISSSTLQHLGARGAVSCQHALFILRWLGRTPESFLVGASPQAGVALANADANQRPRWDLAKLYGALDLARREKGLTWPETAEEIRCRSTQLTGLRTVKFAIDMDLAMRSVQWLERNASDFIDAADW